MNKKGKLTSLMLAGIIIITTMFYAFDMQPVATGNSNNYTYDLMEFSSYDHFSQFLMNLSSGHSYNGRYNYKSSNIMMEASFASGDVVIDYSSTNIQVAGVDEPDFVKTDGTYLYVVSGTKVFIIKARPASNASIVSEIEVQYTISNIFVQGNRLVIFGNSYTYPICKTDIYGIKCSWYSNSNTKINVYDITNKDSPELKKDIVVGGYYYNARMIGDFVYIITTQNTGSLLQNYNSNETIIPQVSINGIVTPIPLSDVQFIDMPSSYYSLTHVISVNIMDESEDVLDKVFLLGNSQTMYVSQQNIYLVHQINRYDYHAMQEIIDEVVWPILPENIKQDIIHTRNFTINDYSKRQVVEWILEEFYQTLDTENRTSIEDEIQRRIQRTFIHKIAIEEGSIAYVANGSVPGRVLNQFSMDENDGFFRIATQMDGNWLGNLKQCTNMYILDEKLRRVSEIENIAPGENMHSARFMGPKAYLVTFKKVDPFFTLDLSDPYNPEILGILKIPGYSDYLHPFDENHIIGIGKDTVESQYGSFAWYQGLKIALFDVSDFENPKEMAKIVIGDRGTDSICLNEHKAFLFDKEKELLVIPVRLYEIDEEIKQQNDGYTGNTYGEFTFQGAFVYKLSLEKGFEYKGRITHLTDDEPDQTNSWGYWGTSSITRSLYIEDVLYTISNSMIKMNDLETLEELISITLQ